MQTEPIISYRNVDSSPAVSAIVEKRIAGLERLGGRLTGCEVVIEAPQKRKVQGRVFRVHLKLHVPGPDVAVSRTVSHGSATDNVVLAVNRAFSAAEKALKRHKKTMGRVEVKHHPPVLHGEVSQLEAELGYGYIRADDGREVYFQRDGLTANNWDQIDTGTRVRFREMEGDKGAFAAAVTIAD